MPHTMYVKFHGLQSYPGFPCSTPCSDLSPATQIPCFELTRTGACRWEGQITQNATCYPVSTMSVSLTCSAAGVDIVAIWIQSGSSLVRWVGHVAASTINCLACLKYELSHNLSIPSDAFPSARCDTDNSSLEVSFQPLENCCQYCPDQYQVTITGIETNAADNKCGEEDCGLLNAVYLLNFVGPGATPRAAGCSQLAATEWCEYSTSAIAFRCIQRTSPPHPYGFCSLHLFVRTLDNCTTQLVVELKYDSVNSGADCTTNEYVGWIITALQNCNAINTTFTMFNHRCTDASWLCRDEIPTFAPPTIHVQAL